MTLWLSLIIALFVNRGSAEFNCVFHFSPGRCADTSRLVAMWSGLGLPNQFPAFPIPWFFSASQDYWNIACQCHITFIFGRCRNRLTLYERYICKTIIFPERNNSLNLSSPTSAQIRLQSKLKSYKSLRVCWESAHLSSNSTAPHLHSRPKFHSLWRMGQC